MNTQRTVGGWDRFLARLCLGCPVCRQARRRPGGRANSFVRRVDSRVCPFCRAYERVYGRKSFEPRPAAETRGGAAGTPERPDGPPAS